MKLLLDTHLLLWLFGMPRAVSVRASSLIRDPGNDLYFSPISLFEIAVKNAKGRSDFESDPSELERELLSHGFLEVPLTSSHAVAITALPPIHHDPFDRLLLAQAVSENMFLLTVDATLLKYPGSVLDAR